MGSPPGTGGKASQRSLSNNGEGSTEFKDDADIHDSGREGSSKTGRSESRGDER